MPKMQRRMPKMQRVQMTTWYERPRMQAWRKGKPRRRLQQRIQEPENSKTKLPSQKLLRMML